MTVAGHLLLLELPVDRAEAASGLLHLAGAQGVEQVDGDALPPPGESAPAAGVARLRGYFGEAAAAEAARRSLEDRLDVHPSVTPIADEPWAESWKRHFRPLRLGRLEVVPPWETARPPPEGTVRLVLEPGMAFGTGSHETTSLCLRAVDGFLAARPGASVLDVGTGSGILAIAAALLGAGRVEATDNDPIAVRVAQENADRNGVGGAVRPSLAQLSDLDGSFDLVLANILANTLVELSAELRARVAPGGQLLLSGLLAAQADDVARAFVGCPGPSDSAHFLELPRRREADWMLLTLQQR